MEQHTITAPLGFPAPIPPDAPIVREVPPDADALANGYVELFVEVEDPAAAAGPEPTQAPPGAIAPHAIPDLPRAPVSPTPFGRQVALLAAVATAVGAIAIAAARPPAAATPAATVRAEPFPPVARAPDLPAPAQRVVPAARPPMRARPAPIRRAAVPVEIGAPAPSAAATAPDAGAGDAIPQPVSAPRLVPAPDGDQSMSEPPLTGT